MLILTDTNPELVSQQLLALGTRAQLFRLPRLKKTPKYFSLNRVHVNNFEHCDLVSQRYTYLRVKKTRNHWIGAISLRTRKVVNNIMSISKMKGTTKII